MPSNSPQHLGQHLHNPQRQVQIYQSLTLEGGLKTWVLSQIALTEGLALYIWSSNLQIEVHVYNSSLPCYNEHRPHSMPIPPTFEVHARWRKITLIMNARAKIFLILRNMLLLHMVERGLPSTLSAPCLYEYQPEANVIATYS